MTRQADVSHMRIMCFCCLWITWILQSPVLEQKWGVTTLSHILILVFIMPWNWQKKICQFSWVVILLDIRFVYRLIDIDPSVTTSFVLRNEHRIYPGVYIAFS